MTKRRNKSVNDENLKQKISSIYGFMPIKGESNTLLDTISRFNNSNSNNNIYNNNISLPKVITKKNILVNHLIISIFIVIKSKY